MNPDYMNLYNIMNGTDLTEKQMDRIMKAYAFAAGDGDEVEDKAKKISAAMLRKKYPALKDAYDQYRMVLKLVQEQERALDEQGIF